MASDAILEKQRSEQSREGGKEPGGAGSIENKGDGHPSFIILLVLHLHSLYLAGCRTTFGSEWHHYLWLCDGMLDLGPAINKEKIIRPRGSGQVYLSGSICP